MASRKSWVLDPNTGGVSVPPHHQPDIRSRIEAYASERFAGRYERLEIRFKGVFCYIDAFVEPQEPSPSLLEITQETKEQFMDRLRSTPRRLCRMRYFGDDRWSFGFFSYSNEQYQLAVFDSGDFFGPIVKGFEVAASVHLFD
jgi:hypothetical protein